MTDIEKVYQLYKELGVNVEVYNYREEANCINLVVHPDDDKTLGYLGFFVDIKFNLDGKFIEFGVWE